MDFDQDYLGKNFVWFFGVVEDRDDPLKLGRVRVRPFSWYTENLSDVPREHLPWAHTIQPTTSASISGKGRSPTGILEGTWVVGFFLDGDDAQQPMIMGTLPGIPQRPANTSIGFSDPNGTYPLWQNEPDTSRLARNENVEQTIVSSKQASRDLSVPIANNTATWDQPHNPYNGRYPYNHVYESESGHIIEVDDSAGSERIHFYHRAGTFIEIDRNGTRVQKTVGDGYEIYERDGYVHIKGSVNVTVDGDANLYIKNNANIDVDGNLNLKVGDTLNVNVGGNTNFTTRGRMSFRANTALLESFEDSFHVRAQGDLNLYSGNTFNSKSVGDTNIDSDTLYWNSDRAAEASVSGLNTPAEIPILIVPSIPPLVEINRDDLFAVYSDDETTNDGLVDDGFTSLATVAIIESGDPNAAPVVNSADQTIDENTTGAVTISPTATTVNQNQTFADTYRLSTNYDLGDLSSRAVVSKYKVRPQHGLTVPEIVENLQNIAVNVAEPILALRSDMIVTSGFRRAKSPTSRSQHERGQAIDIQFVNASKRDYYEIANLIRKEVPFDQLLLEYKNFGTGLPWIHISLKNRGNRGQVLTLYTKKSGGSYNVETVGSGLIQLA